MNYKYIAGFFDGEGSSSVSWRRKGFGCWRAAIAQSRREGEEVLNEIRDFLEAQGIHGNLIRSQGRGTYRTMHYLDFTSRKDVVAFLGALRPHLRVKRVKAQDMLRFDKLFPQLTMQRRGQLSRECCKW